MKHTPLPDITSAAACRDMICRALDEDIASGDATTLALVPEDAVVDAHILAKEDCVVSGGRVAAAVFASLTRAFPLLASSPILSKPTLGFEIFWI